MMMRALRAEFAKLKHSRMPWWTALIVFLLTAVFGFALFPVLAQPEFHAQLLKGGGAFAAAVRSGLYSRTWTSYLRVELQGMTGSWGIMTFGLATAYLFAREFKEGTAKTALTTPIRREHVLLAKFVVLAAWVFGLGLLSVALVSGVAASSGVHGFTWRILLSNVGDMLLVVALLFSSLPLVAFFALSGKGYMRPMLAAMLMWFSCNAILPTAFSRWVPWTMPIHLVGASWNPVSPSPLVSTSWVVAGLVFAAGVAACLWRIDHADTLG